MLMPLLACCVVFPCALPAGPPVEKASGILLWCIERQAVYCDLLHGVCDALPE